MQVSGNIFSSPRHWPVLLVLLSASCGNPDEYGSAAQGIQNAPEAHGTPESIGLRFAQPPSACSGVVLTENWLLTAGHCVAPSVRLNRSAYDQVGLTVTVVDNAGNYLTSYSGRASYYLYPGYDHQHPGRHPETDFALVRLYDGGMHPAPHARIYADDRKLEAHDFFKDVGWGLGNDHGKTCQVQLGAKREGVFAFDSISGHWASAKGKAQYQICGGDSGSPQSVHVGGKDLTFAVATAISRSEPQCSCATTDPDTKVFSSLIRPKMSWIIRKAKEKRIPIDCPVYTTGGYKFRRCYEE